MKKADLFLAEYFKKSKKFNFLRVEPEQEEPEAQPEVLEGRAQLEEQQAPGSIHFRGLWLFSSSWF